MFAASIWAIRSAFPKDRTGRLAWPCAPGLYLRITERLVLSNEALARPLQREGVDIAR